MLESEITIDDVDFESLENSLEYQIAMDEVEKDFMQYAIKIDSEALSYASDKLLNDKEFMLKAIEKDYRSYGYIMDNKLKYDEEIMLKLIQSKI